MEWQLVLLLILGGLIFLMATGMPIFVTFMIVNVIGAFILMGGEIGLVQLAINLKAGVSTFTVLALPLFILMGEVMFHSGIAPYMLSALDKLMGRLPGRLGLMAVAGGTLLSTLTGASMASIAMLGSTLVPEMEKRGYKKPMSLGPILGSGGLAIMIPPSGLAVLFGAIGEISIGRILVAIVIPGLLMAVLYAAYIIGRCQLQPSIAPTYAVPPIPILDKFMSTVKYILPIGFIIFLVLGLIFLGVATPTEAAATGALGTFILAAAYRRLNWQVAKKAVTGAATITVMIFMIIAGAKAFSQLLAFSGATRELAIFVTALPLVPILIFLAMQVVILIMGTFMSVNAIIMITLPVFMPIVIALDFNQVWFAVVTLINIEMGTTSPPFGLSLFVMKGVAPSGTTMGDVYRAALPFLGCDLIAMVLIIAFPTIALWLPGVMR